MTVAELRKALEGLPDEMPVAGYVEGYGTWTLLQKAFVESDSKFTQRHLQTDEPCLLLDINP